MKSLIIPNFTRRGARPLLFVVFAGLATAAAAQIPYDANCKPVELTENEKTVGEFCATHAGCRFLVMAPINAGCKGVNFIRNLGSSISGSGQIRNDDVIDTMTDDFPATSTGQRIIDNVKRAASKAAGAVGKLVRTGDGQIVYEETVDLEGGHKAGSVIAASGQAARGTFDNNYRLQGTGQLITPDGKMRAGTFDNNRLKGEGFVTELDGDRTVLIEGTFDGDTPVGEVIRNYADGSRVRELWENGKMVARGDRAPKGKVPPPIGRPEVKQASAPSSAAGDGYTLVEGPNDKKRWELRCDSGLVFTGAWAEPKKRQVPQKPSKNRCGRETELAGADGSDFSSRDAIERTIEPYKFKPVGGTATPANPEVAAIMAVLGPQFRKNDPTFSVDGRALSLARRMLEGCSFLFDEFHAAEVHRHSSYANRQVWRIEVASMTASYIVNEVDARRFNVGNPRSLWQHHARGGYVPFAECLAYYRFN